MYQVLKTQWRDSAGTPAKRLRRDGYIPGVVYGKGLDPVNLQVSAQELRKFLHHSGKVFEVEVEGKGKYLVNLDNIQKDYLGTTPVHVAFHKLEAGQETTVTIPLHWEGEPVGTKEGGVFNHAISEIDVKGLPSKMPEYISVDVSGLEVNAKLHVSDLVIPEGLTIVHIEAEQTIASCLIPKLEVAPEPEVEEGVEAAAEGETAEAPATEEGAAEAPAEEQKKAS